MNASVCRMRCYCGSPVGTQCWMLLVVTSEGQRSTNGIEIGQGIEHSEGSVGWNAKLRNGLILDILLTLRSTNEYLLGDKREECAIFPPDVCATMANVLHCTFIIFSCYNKERRTEGISASFAQAERGVYKSAKRGVQLFCTTPQRHPLEQFVFGGEKHFEHWTQRCHMMRSSGWEPSWRSTLQQRRNKRSTVGDK